MNTVTVYATREITRECACFIHGEETRFLGYFSSNLDIIIFEYILCI